MNPIHKKHCANHQHVPISPSMFPRLTPLCVAQCKASVPLTGHFCMISLIVPGFLSHVTMVHCRAAWIYPLSGLPRGISGGPSTSQSPNQEDSCRRRYRTNAQRAPPPQPATIRPRLHSSPSSSCSSSPRFNCNPATRIRSAPAPRLKTAVQSDYTAEIFSSPRSSPSNWLHFWERIRHWIP